MLNYKDEIWFTDFFNFLGYSLAKIDDNLQFIDCSHDDLDVITNFINECNWFCDYRSSVRFVGNIELLIESKLICECSQWEYIFSKIADDLTFEKCKQFYKAYIKEKEICFGGGPQSYFISFAFPNSMLYPVVFADYLSEEHKYVSTKDIDTLIKQLLPHSIPGYFLPFIDNIFNDRLLHSQDQCNVFWYCMTKYLMPSICNSSGLMTHSIYMHVVQYYCEILRNILSDVHIHSASSRIMNMLYMPVLPSSNSTWTQLSVEFLEVARGKAELYLANLVGDYQLYRTAQHNKAVPEELANFYKFIHTTKLFSSFSQWDQSVFVTAIGALYSICDDNDTVANWIINRSSESDMKSFLFWMPFARAILYISDISKLTLLAGVLKTSELLFDSNAYRFKDIIKRTVEFIRGVYIGTSGYKGIFKTKEYNMQSDDLYFLKYEIFEKLRLMDFCISLMVDCDDTIEIRRKFLLGRKLINCFGLPTDMRIRINSLFQLFGCEKSDFNRYDKLEGMYDQQQQNELRRIHEEINELAAIEEKTRYGLISESLDLEISGRISRENETASRRSASMNAQAIAQIIKELYDTKKDYVADLYGDFSTRPHEYEVRNYKEINKTCVDFILTTATATETYTLHKYLQPRNRHEHIEIVAFLDSVFYIARLGKYKVAHIQSRPGSFSTGGSYDALRNAISFFKPKLVLSIGIAFGIDPSKQKIGDVMAADYIFPYDKNTFRDGEIHFTNPWFSKTARYISNRLCSIAPTFVGSEFKVIIGGLITGESVVDDPDYKAKIIAPFHSFNIIGGEMEAYGVYKCADENGLLCITIKGVCDYAEGKNKLSDNIDENELIKDGIQLVAMENVCQVIRKMFDKKHIFSDIDLL